MQIEISQANEPAVEKPRPVNTAPVLKAASSVDSNPIEISQTTEHVVEKSQPANVDPVLKAASPVESKPD